MSATLELENTCPDCFVPTQAEFLHWFETTLKHLPRWTERPVNLSIRIVDDDESAALNKSYRHKDTPTNVLSFGNDVPMAILEQLEELPVGDLAICAPVVAREALEQGKPALAHWAHMLVHGVLHLHDFDHIDESQAQIMESLERKILAELGVSDPYVNEKDVSQ